MFLRLAVILALHSVIATAKSPAPSPGSDPLIQGQSEPGLSPDGMIEVSDRSRGKARTFGQQIRRGELPQRTNKALDAMVRFAAYKLKRSGNTTQADKLIKEWENQYSRYLENARDLGDHAPLSKWLADKISLLELILGTQLMKATRLYDLKVINYGLPMVFRCLDHADEVEYGKHFIPLTGVVIYWTSFFVCVGGTWGTGFLFCGPLAMGAEFLTVNLIAPRLNHFCWNLACRPNDRMGLELPEFVPFSNGGYNAQLVGPNPHPSSD